MCCVKHRPTKFRKTKKFSHILGKRLTLPQGRDVTSQKLIFKINFYIIATEPYSPVKKQIFL